MTEGPHAEIRIDRPDLASGPAVLTMPSAADGTYTLAFAFAARARRRPRVLAHQGRVTAADDGWLLALSGRRLWLDAREGVRRRRWWLDLDLATAKQVVLHLRDTAAGGSAPTGAWVGGAALRPVAVAGDDLPFDTHGDFDRVPGLVLGGYTDRAGGHTNVRFGLEDDDAMAGLRVFAGIVPEHRVPWTAVPRPVPQAAPGPPVAGVVFSPGEAGYAGFRIPAVVRAADGALLAFSEGRVESLSDSCRTKHLVCKRSEDGGRSWGGLRIVAAREGRSLMNPSPVVDHVRGSGRVVLAHTRLEGSEMDAQAGRVGARLGVRVSDDHGGSWRDGTEPDLELPEDLDELLPGARPRAWGMLVPTVGHALQLHHDRRRAGRLFYVGNATVGAQSVFDSIQVTFWSDDLGESWCTGPVARRRAGGRPALGLNEATTAELADGSLYINARNYAGGRPAGVRAVTRARFDDDDRLHLEPTVDDLALVDPGVQGSALALPGEGNRLAFANPAHPSARRDLTLRISPDGGHRWVDSFLVQEGASGYCDLVALDEERVGVVYERGVEGEVAFRAIATG